MIRVWLFTAIPQCFDDGSGVYYDISQNCEQHFFIAICGGASSCFQSAESYGWPFL